MTFYELLKQASSINSMLSSCEIPCNVESIELMTDPLRVVVKTEQKEIDDKELDTIKEFYHQIGYEYAMKKACEWIKQFSANIECHGEHLYGINIEQFKQAMEV